jgi:hypothetical protein
MPYSFLLAVDTRKEGVGPGFAVVMAALLAVGMTAPVAALAALSWTG